MEEEEDRPRVPLGRRLPIRERPWLWGIFLLACHASDRSSSTDAAHPTGTPPTDTAGERLAMSSPDLLPSTGNPRADACDWILPDAYACDGPNPDVTWEHAPAGTVAWALVLDDPDARDFSHWAIYDVPGAETGLREGVSGTSALPEGALELQNGFGGTGYLGSCPPPGAHHVYRWRLWALAATLPAGITSFAELEQAAEAEALAPPATLCHLYFP